MSKYPPATGMVVTVADQKSRQRLHDGRSGTGVAFASVPHYGLDPQPGIDLRHTGGVTPAPRH